MAEFRAIIIQDDPDLDGPSNPTFFFGKMVPQENLIEKLFDKTIV